MFIYDLSIFLTSTAFVDTKAKPRARRGERLFLSFSYPFIPTRISLDFFCDLTVIGITPPRPKVRKIF